eukprot:m.1244504 g.1244504  ORF g.1244504 m.1244504 type:complete len:121 (-) comp24684_c0_seq43:1284-1646(-)
MADLRVSVHWPSHSHPSRSEGYGLGIVEAMACGLPVVALSQGVHRDFLTDASSFFIPARKVVCEMDPCGPGGRYIFDPERNWTARQPYTYVAVPQYVVPSVMVGSGFFSRFPREVSVANV